MSEKSFISPIYLIKLKNTQVYAMDFDFLDGKLITICNPDIEITKRQHAIANKERYNPEDAKYLGYSLIFYTTDLTKQEVIKTYFEKDIVEKVYRELKSTTSLHPIRKYRLEYVRAHVKICYLAYAILSRIQNKVKPMQLSAPSALEKLQSAYKALLEAKQEKLKWNKTVTLKREQQGILKLLECSV